MASGISRRRTCSSWPVAGIAASTDHPCSLALANDGHLQPRITPRPARLSDRKPRFVTAPPSLLHRTRRELWLRRGTPSRSNAPGALSSIRLSELGVAAARETFLTTTVPFAAAWTGLFAEMIADCHAMRWRGNGPGVGRDARIAYSGLLGRYMARAYLTAHEGVRVLVPLDEAKRALRETAYCIRKHPPEQ